MGRTIKDARIDMRSMAKLVKNTRVEVSKDRKSARVTGEWAVGADVVSKAAGGSGMTVPVLVTEEQTVALPARRNAASGAMDEKGQIQVALPPQTLKAANATRVVEVDLGLMQPDGVRIPIAKGKLDLAGNWSAPVRLNNRHLLAQATTANGIVRVVFADAAPGGPVSPKK
jgi:hypothetical protein